MNHGVRLAVRWVARTFGVLLALFATLVVVWFVFLLWTSSRGGLLSDAASSVSGAPGP